MLANSEMKGSIIFFHFYLGLNSGEGCGVLMPYIIIVHGHMYVPLQCRSKRIFVVNRVLLVCGRLINGDDLDLLVEDSLRCGSDVSLEF